MGNLDTKSRVLEEIHPFDTHQEKEIKENCIKQIKPYLDSLERWRRESLNSNYRL